MPGGSISRPPGRPRGSGIPLRLSQIAAPRSSALCLWQPAAARVFVSPYRRGATPLSPSRPPEKGAPRRSP
jgi:hypothetical protein